MKHLRNRKGSLYGKLAWLLFLAVLAAAAFFVVLNLAGTYTIHSLMINTDYLKREDNRRIRKLQDYVTEQNLTSTDARGLTDWVERQSVVAIEVYKDGYLVYDSNYPEEDFEEEGPDRQYP